MSIALLNFIDYQLPDNTQIHFTNLAQEILVAAICIVPSTGVNAIEHVPPNIDGSTVKHLQLVKVMALMKGCYEMGPHPRPYARISPLGREADEDCCQALQPSEAGLLQFSIS